MEAPFSMTAPVPAAQAKPATYLSNIAGIARILEWIFALLAVACAAYALVTDRSASRTDFVLAVAAITLLYTTLMVLGSFIADRAKRILGGQPIIYPNQQAFLDPVLAILAFVAGILLISQCSGTTYCRHQSSSLAAGSFSILLGLTLAASSFMSCFNLWKGHPDYQAGASSYMAPSATSGYPSTSGFESYPSRGGFGSSLLGPSQTGAGTRPGYEPGYGASYGGSRDWSTSAYPPPTATTQPTSSFTEPTTSTSATSVPIRYGAAQAEAPTYHQPAFGVR